MKTLLTNLLRGLLVVILFTGTSVVLFTTDVKIVSEAQANVGEAEVIEYLEYCGYQVISVTPKENTISDWKAQVYADGVYSIVIVNVTGNNINGHENVGM